ncbi:MAG TPA: Gfo/Idh/MocA family oxidoreductase [Gemmatimonadota bacterium]|nr:Gfo/Idh/MocA family oxidoreductase [Gemmatimonadota bacterium]
MTRIGILGCGRIARIYHLQILSGHGDAEVGAVAESDEGLLREAQRVVPAARAFADWRAVLEDGLIDAVVVCLPTGLHSGAAVAAFEAGKHVYLEKPIATTLEAAGDVVAAWRTSGRIGMIGFNQRFHPLVISAREAIREGRIGRIVGARMTSGASPRDLPAWKRQRASGGGALLDSCSHHADLARFLFDNEVRDVTASVSSLRSEDDNAWTTMTMESGVRVESRASFTSVQENRFEITGEAGGLSVDRIEGRMRLHPVDVAWSRVARLRREIRRLASVPDGVRGLLTSPRDPSYRLALSAFARAVRERSPLAPDPCDGERSLAVVLAAEASARDGRRVLVAPPLP